MRTISFTASSALVIGLALLVSLSVFGVRAWGNDVVPCVNGPRSGGNPGQCPLAFQHQTLVGTCVETCCWFDDTCPGPPYFTGFNGGEVNFDLEWNEATDTYYRGHYRNTGMPAELCNCTWEVDP
jgi:hypothetical protein